MTIVKIKKPYRIKFRLFYFIILVFKISICYGSNEEDEEDSSSSYSERVLPYSAALFPDDIDYSAIKEFIEKEVQGDNDAENIFLGIYTYGMKRREVIEEFTMTAVVFDNGMRRLTTVINRAAAHFNKNTQTV